MCVVVLWALPPFRVGHLCFCFGTPARHLLRMPAPRRTAHRFPDGFEYRWADGVGIKKPIKCTSTDYIDYVMTCVYSLAPRPRTLVSRQALASSERG